MFNTPNDKSRPGYLKMGWHQVGRPPSSVRVRSPLGLALHAGLPGSRRPLAAAGRAPARPRSRSSATSASTLLLAALGAARRTPHPPHPRLPEVALRLRAARVPGASRSDAIRPKGSRSSASGAGERPPKPRCAKCSCPTTRAAATRHLARVGRARDRRRLCRPARTGGADRRLPAAPPPRPDPDLARHSTPRPARGPRSTSGNSRSATWNCSDRRCRTGDCQNGEARPGSGRGSSRPCARAGRRRIARRVRRSSRDAIVRRRHRPRQPRAAALGPSQVGDRGPHDPARRGRGRWTHCGPPAAQLPPPPTTGSTVSIVLLVDGRGHPSAPLVFPMAASGRGHRRSARLRRGRPPVRRRCCRRGAVSRSRRRPPAPRTAPSVTASASGSRRTNR